MPRVRLLEMRVSNFIDRNRAPEYLAMHVMMHECRQSMGADQSVADPGDHFVDFFELVGEPVVRANQGRQIEAKKGCGLAAGTENQPAKEGQRDHKDLKRDVDKPPGDGLQTGLKEVIWPRSQ